MKYLSLLVGVLILGNVACAEEPEPGVIEFTGSAYVQITGELNGEPNLVTGRLMLGLVQGLTTGNCWGGNTDPYITATFMVHPPVLPSLTQSLTWRNAPGLGEITLIGGDGSCDSVIYNGITKVWPYGGLDWTWGLWEAKVGRCQEMFPLEPPIAEQYPHWAYNDSVSLNDYVQPSWELTAHLADAVGEGNFGTAQLAYDLAEGMGYDNMPYGLYLDFYYNNADTSRRTVSAETWANMDTSEVRAIYTAQDTIRNTDSLYGIDLINSQGGIIARDTVDRYVPTNNAVKWVQTIYLVKWPP